MRQRKPKHLEEKIAANQQWLLEDAADHRGRWRACFPGAAEEARLFLEIGSGKGQFLLSQARQNPQGFYLGFESRESVLLRALEKAELAARPHIRFCRICARDLRALFAEGELDGLYLNFSDPWPKDRHAKRRLTHAAYLHAYRDILKPGAFVEYKTDDADFFAFSVAEILRTGFLRLCETSEDLHASNLSARETTTEYEDRFLQWNRRIFYLKAEA